MHLLLICAWKRMVGEAVLVTDNFALSCKGKIRQRIKNYKWNDIWMIFYFVVTASLDVSV